MGEGVEADTLESLARGLQTWRRSQDFKRNNDSEPQLLSKEGSSERALLCRETRIVTDQNVERRPRCSITGAPLQRDE